MLNNIIMSTITKIDKAIKGSFRVVTNFFKYGFLHFLTSQFPCRLKSIIVEEMEL